MAVQTPVTGSLSLAVLGNIRYEATKFASVANNDTYTSTLSLISGLSVDGGSTGGTLGATWTNGVGGAGAVITFLSSSGSITNVTLACAGL